MKDLESLKYVKKLADSVKPILKPRECAAIMAADIRQFVTWWAQDDFEPLVIALGASFAANLDFWRISVIVVHFDNWGESEAGLFIVAQNLKIVIIIVEICF